VAILDGNVKRVLTRVLAFEGDLALAAEERRLWLAADGLLPSHSVDVYTQGLMDLGATVCLARRPACAVCPLAADCAARRAGTVERYPVRGRRLVRGRRENALVWLEHRGRSLLVRRAASGVWGGLWSLPEYASRPVLERAAAAWPGQGEWLPTIEHALTHFDWTLHPLAWRWPTDAPLQPELPPSGRWLTINEALALGLPAPVRRLLRG
jgi:A/G-specific adenine glycosylase